MSTTLQLDKAPIGQLLFKLALPNIFAQVVNMLYNIVDRMYIGRIPEVGPLALTGVGIAFPIFIIIMSFSSLIGIGGAPQAAIKMGEGKRDEAEKILGTGVTTLLLLSLTLSVIFFTFGQDLLQLFGASDETLPFAWDYLKIISLGAITIQFSLGLNPYISTQGFALFSMVTILIGAGLNIILDPIFIFVFDMGVTGAAIATVISQAVSAVWVLIFLTGKKTRLKIRLSYLKVNPTYLIMIVTLGISPYIMQSTESLLNITFNRSLQLYGGDLAVGAMTITASLMQMLILPLMGLSQGAQPIMSYNYGAGHIDRVKQTFRLLFITSLGYSFLFWLSLRLFPHAFIGFFTNDPALIQTTTYTLSIYMAVVFMFGAQIACQQAFIALSQARVSLFLALLRKIILLIPLILILPRFMENQTFAVLVSEPIADFISVVTTVAVFFYLFNKILTKRQTELSLKQTKALSK